VREVRRRSTILLCLGLVSILGSRQSTEYVTGDDFFRKPALWAIKVSPTGEFFAADVENSLDGAAIFFESDRLGSEEVGVFIRHIQSKTAKAALRAEGIIHVIKWVDDDTLFVSYKEGGQYYECSIDVEYTEGELSFDVEFIRAPGWMIHGTPNQKDEILWAYAKKKQTIVYRAPLAKLEEFEPRKRGRRSRPWKGLEDEYIVAKLDGYVPW
jgi:hypothetical protein